MSDFFLTHPAQNQPQIKHQKHYTKTQGEFLSHHFGHYSIRFIEMIAKDATKQFEKI